MRSRIPTLSSAVGAARSMVAFRSHAFCLRLALLFVLVVAGASVFAADCSGYYTRSDGSYNGTFFGLTRADRIANVEAWCGGPPCVTTLSNQLESSFDYTYEVPGVASGGGHFTDNAGADCVNAPFAAEGSASSPGTGGSSGTVTGTVTLNVPFPDAETVAGAWGAGFLLVMTPFALAWAIGVVLRMING